MIHTKQKKIKAFFFFFRKKEKESTVYLNSKSHPLELWFKLIEFFNLVSRSDKIFCHHFHSSLKTEVPNSIYMCVVAMKLDPFVPIDNSRNTINLKKERWDSAH